MIGIKSNPLMYVFYEKIMLTTRMIFSVCSALLQERAICQDN